MPPKRLAPVQRLQADTEALTSLFTLEKPSQVLLRTRRVYTILYGFTDTSGSGFGSTIVMLDGGIRYRIGTWGVDEEETSNFREFENVVGALHEEEAAGNLQDALMFLCTDNSTIEITIVKGNSSSKNLFALALEMRQIEVRLEPRLPYLMSLASA